MNKNDLNEPQCEPDNSASFISHPTFLARIRATRRVISDGHQFSPKAVIAEHSSLCMAQSAFYTHKHTHYNSTEKEQPWGFK